MAGPIRPEDIEIDRTAELAWCEIINAELVKPWGDLFTKTIELGKQTGFDHEKVGGWLVSLYESVGWKCSMLYGAGPKPRTLVFSRPYPKRGGD